MGAWLTDGLVVVLIGVLGVSGRHTATPYSVEGWAATNVTGTSSNVDGEHASWTHVVWLQFLDSGPAGREYSRRILGQHWRYLGWKHYYARSLGRESRLNTRLLTASAWGSMLFEAYVVVALVIIALTVIGAAREKRRRARPQVGPVQPRHPVQQRRNAALARRWAELLYLGEMTPDAGLVVIKTVCQPARRGAKAVIMWITTGEEQDAWFEGHWPEAGAFALVEGITAWGPHNENPDVFYMGSEQVLCMVPRGTVDAVERHRLRKAARRGVD